MFSRLREHLGTAGLLVAVVALVAALGGGAIAASGGSGDGKATASAKKKAKKGPRGPRGPKGDTGPAGPAGPAGPQGAKGDTGAAGSNGSNGADGAKGATGPTGSQGLQGIKGAIGPTGPTGQSGFTETLPSGETETGAWAFGKNAAGGEVDFPISFAIPLAAPLAADKVHMVEFDGIEWKEAVANEETFARELVPQTACDGSAVAPAADPGHLCVYINQVENAMLISKPDGIRGAGSNNPGADPSGAVVFSPEATAGNRGRGTFAVTAP